MLKIYLKVKKKNLTESKNNQMLYDTNERQFDAYQ